jgi:hypothetical protein
MASEEQLYEDEGQVARGPAHIKQFGKNIGKETEQRVDRESREPRVTQTPTGRIQAEWPTRVIYA